MREGNAQVSRPKPHRIDWRATWELVKAFASTREVVYVFLEYKLQRRLFNAAEEAGASESERAELIQWPRGRYSGRGLVRHSPGHVGHIHVRFTCGPYEPECVALPGPDAEALDASE